MNFRVAFQRILFFSLILLALHSAFYILCKYKELLSQECEIGTKLTLQIEFTLVALSASISIITELSKKLKTPYPILNIASTEKVKNEDNEKTLSKLKCTKIKKNTLKARQTKKLLKIKQTTIIKETRTLEIATNNIGNNPDTFDIFEELSDNPK